MKLSYLALVASIAGSAVALRPDVRTDNAEAILEVNQDNHPDLDNPEQTHQYLARGALAYVKCSGGGAIIDECRQWCSCSKPAKGKKKGIMRCQKPAKKTVCKGLCRC